MMKSKQANCFFLSVPKLAKEKNLLQFKNLNSTLPDPFNFLLFLHLHLALAHSTCTLDSILPLHWLPSVCQQSFPLSFTKLLHLFSLCPPFRSFPTGAASNTFLVFSPSLRRWCVSSVICQSSGAVVVFSSYQAKYFCCAKKCVVCCCRTE